MLEQALRHYHRWGLEQQPKLVRQFKEGKNHQTGLIEQQGQYYVLKLFAHSFDSAITGQKHAAVLGIAPDVLYADDNTLLMRYVEGGTPDLGAIANSLRILHSSTLTLNTLHKRNTKPPEKLDLISAIDDYLENASNDLKQHHQRFLPYLLEFTEDTTATCFCHNDLVMENCLSQDGAALFIDWEYAAPNNPWFDLASIVLYKNLDESQSRFFLNAYQRWQSKVDERIFLIAQVVVLWVDLLWHANNTAHHNSGEQEAKLKRLIRLVAQLQSK